MSYGSYYQSTPNYFRNPVPYTSSDIGEPVPGWGVNPQVAGPSRLGVGAFGAKIPIPKLKGGIRLGYTPKTTTYTDQTVYAEPEASGIPWWIWPVAAAVVVGGVGYYGTKKGWF